MIISVTGHRPNKLGNDYDLKSPLIQKIKDQIIEIVKKENPDKLMGGMALGIDTLFALISIELKIPFIAAIPFIGQEKKWPKKSQDMYNKLLENPLVEKVIVCEGGYSPEKMQIRNQYMVDNSDKIIAVWDGTFGGTGNCVGYAKSVGKEIIRIHPRKI